MIDVSAPPRTSDDAAQQSTLAVLIVDDDVGIRSSVARILKQDGYRVDLAESAAEAIDRHNWSNYFAILLDRRLPDTSGDDLLLQIRERAPDAAVLIITGYADLQSSLAAIQAGASDYLLKPVDPAELRTRLQRLADLRLARDELQERDRQIRFMIQHLPAGAAYVNASTGHVRLNKTLETMTGYEAGELQTLDDWFDTLFPSDRQAHYKAYLKDRAASFPKSRVLPIQRRDGAEILAEFSGYRYNDHEVWLINDITERQRVQEELRQQRDFLERLVDTAQVIVLVLDTEGRVIQFNRFMQELCGYKVKEVIGKSWFDTFLSPDEADAVKSLFARVVAGEEVNGHVNAVKTRDDRERQIAWWAKPLRDAEGHVTEVLSIGHDITTLQHAQEKLVQSERLAAIGQMITGLAHESRNALQRARACLDMLSLDLGEQPEQVELTRRTQVALDELQRLYEEVRGYAAPIKLSRGSCDLWELWHTSWQYVVQAHGECNVSLKEAVEVTDTRCLVDRHRIGQVFRNVLENAIAVSPPNSEISLRCESGEANGRAALRVTITDQGPGLSAEQAERIFEPFYTTKQKGTGLGMPISRRFVEAHGGSLELGRDQNAGATIVITLPRKYA